MKSFFLVIVLVLAYNASVAQQSNLTFSVHGSSSHILFIKDRPNNNFYTGVSGANRNYHLTPKLGAAIEYQRSFMKRPDTYFGIGIRYAQKGQNITYYDTAYKAFDRIFNGIGGYHKAVVHYLQLPITIEKRYNWKDETFTLQTGLIPEIKVYGSDNYNSLVFFHRPYLVPEAFQRKYSVSTFVKGGYCLPLHKHGLLRMNLYAEYQLSRYFETFRNYRNNSRFGIKDPNSTWGFYSHLARTHLFNVGIEIGYSFGLGSNQKGR